MAGSSKAVLHSVCIGDLFSEDADTKRTVQQTILKAFAEPESLGVIAVDGVSDLLGSRAALLPLAAQLAGLPKEALEGLEHPQSNYLIGWSRGKEILANGEPDTNKGSFYANPLVDKRRTASSSDIAAGWHDCNVWPEEELPALQSAFKATGKLISETATAIMANCDRIVREHKQNACVLNTEPQTRGQQEPSTKEHAEAATTANCTPCSTAPSSGETGQVVDATEGSCATTGEPDASEAKVGQKRSSPSSDSPPTCEKGSSPTCDSSATCCEPASDLNTSPGMKARIHVPVSDQKSNKARLLHYFPPDPATYHLAGDWCGWHFDIGTITGLTAGMYLPANCTDSKDEVGSPDGEAGLHVRSHDGSVVRVAARKDQLLFQVGQSLQVMSAGLFKATEHYVRAPKSPMNVSRSTFAVFCQPNADDILQPVVDSNSIDFGVSHWVPGITFGQFRDRVTAASCPKDEQ